MLDGAVVGALVFLALGVTALLATTWTLIPQINKTLGAYEKLADTLEAELGPTLKEVQKSSRQCRRAQANCRAKSARCEH